MSFLTHSYPRVTAYLPFPHNYHLCFSQQTWESISQCAKEESEPKGVLKVTQTARDLPGCGQPSLQSCPSTCHLHL